MRFADGFGTFGPRVYRLLFRLVLLHLSAEWVHRTAFLLLRLSLALAPLRHLVRRWLGPRAPELAVSVFGRSVPSPIGLAAGFDKDARGHEALGALGFGFIEVGTVTPLPQPGNPRPRMWRLPADRALLNRLGFNNRGVEAAAARLDKPRETFLGVNIGKNKATPPETAIADYVIGARRLGPHADYLVVNVSSPNTPGLRALQNVETLRPLLIAVRAALDESSPQRRVPLLVKIDPDQSDAELDAIAALALDLRLDGIIATNTTVKPQNLRTPVDQVGDPPKGGVSGAPLKARSLAVLQRLRAQVGDRLVLISVGGIETVDDVWTRLRAGATLVQVYSAFIYEGPLFLRRLNQGLRARLAAEGRRSINEIVGADARPAA
ncbi:MAG TPA: quinone-dependent dihydroorotate dehydrogenase [Polyangia bacterium]